MSDYLRYLQPLNCQSSLKIFRVERDPTRDERERWGVGIMYFTLWHGYKTFTGVTRPHSLLKWVLDIRDQCFFLVRVITHGALSAIFSRPVARRNIPFGAQRLSSSSAPTPTDLPHLHPVLTITPLPTLATVTHKGDPSLKHILSP